MSALDFDIAESDSQVRDSGLSGQQSQILEDTASPQDLEAEPSQSSSVQQSTITSDTETIQSSSTVENSSELQNSSQQDQHNDSNNTGDENSEDATSYEKLGIITARPESVEYTVCTTRLNPFNIWPKDKINESENQMKQSRASADTPLSQDDNSNEVISSQPPDENTPHVMVTNFSNIAESDSQARDSGLSRQQSPILEGTASPQALSSQSSSVPQSTITGDTETVQSSSTVENSNGVQNSSQQDLHNDSNNAGIENTGDATVYEKFSIITARPKRFEYSAYKTRLNSFNEWPKDHCMKPEDLAKAGYFYTGHSDCARCFYCGGGLRNWEGKHDVWVEHARWFPKCAFLLQEVGKDFIDTVQTTSKERDEIKFDDVIKRMPSGAPTPFKLKERPIERDPAVLSVVDTGFDRNRIIILAQEIRKSGEVISSDKLYAAAMARNLPKKECSNKLGSDSVSMRKGGNEKCDKETTEALRIENNELRSKTMCKICMDKEVAVVFLPCGHLVSCTECSCTMTLCPVCHFGIKGIVRAHVG